MNFVLNLVYSIRLCISQHYLLLFLMQTDTTPATTNAVITNTASNPGTVSFDEVDADVDEFSGCVVGVDAGGGISWGVVGVDVDVDVGVGVGVGVGTGVGDASVRTESA